MDICRQKQDLQERRRHLSHHSFRINTDWQNALNGDVTRRPHSPLVLIGKTQVITLPRSRKRKPKMEFDAVVRRGGEPPATSAPLPCSLASRGFQAARDATFYSLLLNCGSPHFNYTRYSHILIYFHTKVISAY